MTDLIPAPRPVPTPEDRMRDARQPGPTFATYLDRHDRDQLDARAAAAEAERDDARDDRDAARAEAANLREQLDRANTERARLAAELSADLVDEIGNREQADKMCDDLAEAIARLTGIDIGEHSSMNDPWQNALQAATEAAERAEPPVLGSPRRAQEEPVAVPEWRYLDPASLDDEPARCRKRCADPLDLVHRCTKPRGHVDGHSWATEHRAEQR